MLATAISETRVPKVSQLGICVIILVICINFVDIIHGDGHLKVEDHARLSYFILKFYKTSFVEEENMVMSPLAVRLLLSAVYPSATGSTRLEMESRLKLRKLDPMIVYKVLEEVFRGEKNLHIANRVFVNRGVWLKPIYRKHPNFEKVDFDRASLSAEIINEWSAEATAGHMHNIIDPTEMHEDLQMILINAIHFKAPWRIPFYERRTRKQLFYTKSGRVVRTNVMVQHSGHLRYTQSPRLQAQIIEIPYATSFVMWILLPSLQSNLNELVRKFSVADLREINGNLTATRISLELPKFSIDTVINGKDVLMQMGASSMFIKPELDIAMGRGRYHVDELKQRARVEITEEGSQLNIISWVGILQRISAEFPTFHANRPFMFLILTTKSLVPIFLGHLAKPSGDIIKCIFQSTNKFDHFDDC